MNGTAAIDFAVSRELVGQLEPKHFRTISSRVQTQLAHDQEFAPLLDDESVTGFVVESDDELQQFPIVDPSGVGGIVRVDGEVDRRLTHRLLTIVEQVSKDFMQFVWDRSHQLAA